MLVICPNCYLLVALAFPVSDHNSNYGSGGVSQTSQRRPRQQDPGLAEGTRGGGGASARDAVDERHLRGRRGQAHRGSGPFRRRPVPIRIRLLRGRDRRADGVDVERPRQLYLLAGTLAGGPPPPPGV